MSAKKRGGGRVTPKGTQPATTKGKSDGDANGHGTPWAPPGRVAPATPGRGSVGPVAPTRSGHHRGNR